MVKIAVIGFGNIGGGLVQLLDDNKAILANDCGTEIEIKYIVDVRDFSNHPLKDKIISDFSIVENDPEVKIVAEMIGGSHPAFEFSMAAMKAGKSVVTSNKEVVANYGEILLQTAKDNGVSYLFEAAVGGAIPIIRPMCASLSSDEINYIDAILNGTTNYILTSMLEGGVAFEDALQSAKELGYAEANPSADVEGVDACRKICILSALAYGKIYPCECVYTEGIGGITSRDASDAVKKNASIKLIAHTQKNADGSVSMYVCPRFVPHTHPLYGVNSVYNGIFVSAKASGDLMFYGMGAGRIPTAGAVMSDIVQVVKHLDSKQLSTAVWTRDSGAALKKFEDEEFVFYVRVEGATVPIGVCVISSEDGETSFYTAKISEKQLSDTLKGYKVSSKIRYI